MPGTRVPGTGAQKGLSEWGGVNVQAGGRLAGWGGGTIDSGARAPNPSTALLCAAASGQVLAIHKGTAPRKEQVGPLRQGLALR